MQGSQEKIDQFALEVYKCLREEIIESITAQRNLEVVSVGGIAAMYSFLFANHDVLLWVWLAPVAISTFGLVRTFAYLGHLSFISKYLKTIERRYEPNEGFWECYGERRRAAGDIRVDLFGYTSAAIFIVLLIITVWMYFIKRNGGI